VADVTFPQCTRPSTRARALARCCGVFRGKETAGPKNTHIIEQKNKVSTANRSWEFIEIWLRNYFFY